MNRTAVSTGYESLAAVLDQALEQSQSGKGKERHAVAAERFEDQQIVQLGEWMGNTGFAIGQACKKALESTRLKTGPARRELLGAIVYLAAAVVMLDRQAAVEEPTGPQPPDMAELQRDVMRQNEEILRRARMTVQLPGLRDQAPWRKP